MNQGTRLTDCTSEFTIVFSAVDELQRFRPAPRIG
jgi:hypothetical protein